MNNFWKRIDAISIQWLQNIWVYQFVASRYIIVQSKNGVFLLHFEFSIWTKNTKQSNKNERN